MSRITIHVCTKDRHSELALLLQSLRTQTYKEWDLIILDSASGNPIINAAFLTALLNRIKLENHKVKLLRENVSFGVCQSRNHVIREDTFDNPYTCRLDDDVILEPDYLEKLVEVINSGYDIASGVTPLMMQPELERENKFVKPIINAIGFDEEGNITKFGDDCGYTYMESEIIRAHHFRSCALYKSELHPYYPENLSPTGFREESFASIRWGFGGYRIGVHTKAIAWHLQCQSGGVRSPDYAKRVQSDDQIFKEWVKKEYGRLSEGDGFPC